MWSTILTKGRSFRTLPSDWTSSDSIQHHRFSQLWSRNEHEILSFKGNLFEEDDDDDDVPILKTKRVKEPPGMWYYVSSHILINDERAKRNIVPLTRKHELDEIAREHAQRIMEEGRVSYIDLKALFRKVSKPCRRLAQNVACGESVAVIHEEQFKKSKAELNNIIDRRLRYMGVGTAKDSIEDKIYICQIFTG